ncbi:MAG: NAD(P)-dependent oxidoreductase [Candidatus Omnitrophica bacterium]|nr:NAD(P)-dependent oxidoreductase [Candidatus Omnitrophota bacterium]
MNITVIGTGLMGYPMAQRLLKAQYKVSVYNRTVEKTQGLREGGAIVYSTAKEAVEAGEVILLMLTDAQAVKDVLYHDHIHLAGKIVIQMGTIAPQESKDMARAVENNKGYYAECPVLGSRHEAAEGKLILMYGGEKKVFEHYKELLSCFGPQPKYIGQVGQAAALKLAFNQLIAAHASAFSVSLALVLKNEIDITQFMTILRDSALYAPMFDKKLSNWLNGRYENPNFPTKHLLKDVKLVVQACRLVGVDETVVEAIKGMFQNAQREGLAELDYSSVYKVFYQKSEK